MLSQLQLVRMKDDLSPHARHWMLTDAKANELLLLAAAAAAAGGMERESVNDLGLS